MTPRITALRRAARKIHDLEEQKRDLIAENERLRAELAIQKELNGEKEKE